MRFLYRAMKLSNDCDLNYKASKNKRLLVELTLIQIGQLTSEEDDVSGGRSPKQLKPFLQNAQQAAAPQPAATQPAVAQPVATQPIAEQSQVARPSAPSAQQLQPLKHPRPVVWRSY